MKESSSQTLTPINDGLSEDTKTLIVALTLLLVWPLGLVFMFMWMKWPMWVKLLISGILLLLVLIPFIILFTVFFSIIIAFFAAFLRV
ncbi:hypothetical protein HY408_00850 [Candidatus Gottesmanbacteria bacterium]|nr:hypothetical protein [Candidatus Gottesmanbacteria bacterium]